MVGQFIPILGFHWIIFEAQNLIRWSWVTGLKAGIDKSMEGGFAMMGATQAMYLELRKYKI